ncbi:uncharacterized protein IAS62_005198 [Cryptococcus decagattii]|uniref:Coatomer subunit delta n=1 Tax=Cryptococcus decagattii TaxID=1859122 RepID=A0ABZ2B2H1_9TREE
MVVIAASICTRSGKRKSHSPNTADNQPSSLASSGPSRDLASTVSLRLSQSSSLSTLSIPQWRQMINILQDISTLSLLVRLIASLTPSMTEAAILHHSFDLLCAFDEVVSLGYKENVSLMQVRNVLEGESHEEKIQEIIARNKEAEAKEELKRRAKQLEMQRREQQRRAQGGGGMGNVGGFGGMAGGYSPASRYDAPSPAQEYRAPSPAAVSVPSKPAFKGSGMKLGSKKGKQSDLMNALGGEDAEPEEAD